VKVVNAENIEFLLPSSLAISDDLLRQDTPRPYNTPNLGPLRYEREPATVETFVGTLSIDEKTQKTSLNGDLVFTIVNVIAQ
jgi:hypothetical protein